MARSTCRSQNVQNTSCLDHFWKLRCRKSAHRCGAKHISKSKVQKNCGSGPLLDVQMSFRVAGVGHLKRICKDALSVAGAVQETCSSELLGGPGDDFLTEVAFCCIFSFGKMILRDRCSTSYDLASLFCGRRSTLYRKTHWYEAVSSALSFPFLKEVSQNCFVFDVVNFEN